MKKTLFIAGIATGIAILATAFIAAAQTAPTTTSVSTTVSQQPILEVGAAGKVLMRGTIASIGSGSLTVTSWGGTWTVSVPSSAEILPAAAGNDLTQFKVGDFVGVQGTVDSTNNWTIDATLVRDWTYRAAVVQQRQTNIASARTTIEGGTPKNYAGVATNLSGSTFTLTVNGVADTVNVASGAEVVNRSYLTLPLASINSGDSIRVWGVNASGTITAQIVRDMSIPATSTAQ